MNSNCNCDNNLELSNHETEQTSINNQFDEDFEDDFPDGVFAVPFTADEPPIKVLALSNYCRETGKKPYELSAEELERFIDRAFEGMDMFDSYLNWWRESFFDGESIDEIIAGIEDDYRKNRFIAMWFMKSKDEFWNYYVRREELGLVYIFNAIIATLFHETDKKEYKKHCIELLEISQDMIDEEVLSYDIKVLQKDINSYEFYRKKKLGLPLYEQKK